MTDLVATLPRELIEEVGLRRDICTVHLGKESNDRVQCSRNNTRTMWGCRGMEDSRGCPLRDDDFVPIDGLVAEGWLIVLS